LFILAFLTVVIGSSFTLFAWRAPTVGLGARFALFSKETALLGNNVLFVVAAGAVLLGTLYPLLLDALGMGKISVGPPYFDTVFVPLMAPAIFLMGVGPMARWKETSIPDLASRLKWAVVVAVVAALVTGWLAGSIHLMASFGLLMAFWIVSSVATDFWERVKPEGKGFAEIRRKTGLIPRALAGMMAAHLGVAAFCFGVTMVKTYEVESDVRMAVGDSTTVRGYAFTFKGVKDVQGPNYDATRATIEITRNGNRIVELSPEKRIFRVQQTPMTEAAIAPGLTGDLYVSMGEEVDGGAWIIRIYVKPFIDWVWGGCLLMAFGGLLAVSDRRYRRKAPASETAGSVAASGATA
jgi:cytochrome c-type biogenesis protein CcmF